LSRVLIYLGKFAHMVLGYAAASLAAGAFLNVVFLGFTELIAPDMPPEVATGTMIVTLPVTALIVAYFAFVPAIIAMLLTELLGKRDWLFYALAGGFVALVLVVQGYQSGDADFARYGEPLVPVYMIGAGLVGGIAYWFVTGRFAGALRAISPAP
jgi:mannose/fructose/N-acetylgalactosamine-specific phosphotransferase system component IIC